MPDRRIAVVVAFAGMGLLGAPLRAELEHLSRATPQGVLTGRLLFDGKSRTRPRDVSRFIVFLWDVTQERLWRRIEVFMTPNIFPFAHVQADATFELTGLVPGVPYTVEVGRSEGWVVRSAMVGSIDIRDEPLVLGGSTPTGSPELIITMSDAACTVRGRVQSDTGVNQAAVLIFSTDKRHWHLPWRRVRTARVGMGGTFLLRGLPPGTYYLVATTPPADGADLRDETTLSALIPKAQKIELVEGREDRHDLRLSR